MNSTINDGRVHTVSGLTPRTEYTFKITAVSDSGKGPDDTIKVTTGIPEGT